MSRWKKTASKESIHAMWHDPSTFDPLKMGPPYLPGMDVKPVYAKVASDALAVREMVASEREIADAEFTALLGINAEPMAELGAFLVFLRTVAQLHLSHHWQTHGFAFYADHLLFERLYTEMLPMIDAVAERTVGSGSPSLVDPVLSLEHMTKVVRSLYSGMPANPEPEDLVKASLTATLRLLSCLRLAYELLEARDFLSNGTDNLLQDIADKLESHTYLLKQRSTTSLYAR